MVSSARARGSQAVDPWLTSKIYETVDESVAEPAACWGKARPLQPPAQPYAREYHNWAMTDQPPPSPPLIALQSPTACAELRQCIQHCYALSLSRRYNKAKGAASQPRSNK